MNELELIDALAARLERLFYGWTLPGKNGKLQNVKIFAQYIPQAEGITLNTYSENAIENYTG
ncbi:MAG: hypothetical protein IJL01_03250, partial [Synergistaceae bacterium]|nr:hypothetical protein [Synergistaceae bacterium]